MKVKINGYEVSFTAKHIWQKKATKKAALEFLNELSIVYNEAANDNSDKGYIITAKEYCDTANDLYNFNKERGLYSEG